MAQDETIYILDEIKARPGQGEALLKRYLEEFAPIALAKGMKLEHRLVSPPMWLEGNQSNTLFIMWSVKGVAGYWGATAKTRNDPAAENWWREIEADIVHRRRSVMSEDSSIASLTDV